MVTKSSHSLIPSLNHYLGSQESLNAIAKSKLSYFLKLRQDIPRAVDLSFNTNDRTQKRIEPQLYRTTVFPSESHEHSE